MLVNQTEMTRLGVVYDKREGSFVFNFYDDTSGAQTSVRIKDTPTNVISTFELFRDSYVNGTSLGTIELFSKEKAQSAVPNTFKLSKHGVFVKYYNIRSGVFIDGIELSYTLQDENYYDPEISDLDDIINTMKQEMYKTLN